MKTSDRGGFMDKIADEEQNKISEELSTFELNCAHAFKQVQNKESDYARVDLPLNLNGYIDIENMLENIFMARIRDDEHVVISTITFNYSDVDGQNEAYFLDFIKTETYDFMKRSKNGY